MKKQVTILLAFACALVPATAAVATAVARTSRSRLIRPRQPQAQPDAPEAEAASDRLQRAYRRWRRKLERYGVWRGAISWPAARVQERPPTASRAADARSTGMQKRFYSFLRTPEGRAALVPLQGATRIPRLGPPAPALDRLVRVEEQPARHRRRRRLPRHVPVQLQHLGASSAATGDPAAAPQLRADLACVAAAEPPRRRPLAGLRLGTGDSTRAGPPASARRRASPRLA